MIVVLMEVNIYNLDGAVSSKIKLPTVFGTPVRKRIIERAVLSADSAKLQPKGNYYWSGRLTTAQYVGRRDRVNAIINKGVARKPHTKNRRSYLEGRVMGIPGVVGGPRAHPPKVENVLAERINKKERVLAIKSAIACIQDKEMVKKRGHIFGEELTLPVIVVNDLESFAKTKEVLIFLKKLGLDKDVTKAKNKKNIRAGKGKARGRKYKRAKSMLFIVSKDGSKLYKAARNLEGVEVVAARNISARDLAPAGVPGRLTVLSKDALEQLGKKYM